MVARHAAAAVGAVVLVLAESAAALPPPNDNRANAAPVRVGAVVYGSTTGSTKEPGDPFAYCGSSDGTVWFKVTEPPRGRLVLRFVADGELDAYVAVFKVVRSRLELQNCDATDRRGRAALSFNADPDSTYLIEVARLTGSVDDNFHFRLFEPEPSSRPPGKALPRRGVTSAVDPLVDFDDAWSVRMRPGIAYRVNLAPARNKCVGLSVYRPGTRSFADTRPVHSLRCGGYLTLTPGPGGGGRYTLLVTASGTRAGNERYHLAAGVAAGDDRAPGFPLANLQTRRGSLNARGLDVVDLYRFDVATRSDVTLRLRTGGSSAFDLLVLGETGHRLGCQCGSTGSQELTTRLPAGHYFAVVRARRFTHGGYSLALLVRQITTTRVTFGATPAPHHAVSVTADVTFATRGRVSIRIERFDPLMGWQFARRYRRRLGAGGTATATFVPPTVGRWRARAFYSGTRTTSPSKSGFATLVVH
jgi:hypothetical protein